MNAVTDKPVAANAAALSVADAPPRRPSRLRGRLLRAAAGLVALAAAAVVGNWWLAEGRAVQSTDNAYVSGDIAVLGSRIEGDVLAIHVADNQHVHAGDALITLDPRDWQARLDQARGAAAEAAAAIVTARSQVDQGRAAIGQAEAMIAQARAEQVRAVAEAGRVGHADHRGLELALR